MSLLNNPVTPEDAVRHIVTGMGPVCDDFTEQPEPSAYWCGTCHWNRDIHGDETSRRNIADAVANAQAAAEHGWDKAEYTCGRCYATVTATTEREFVRLVADHRAACHRAAAQGA